MKFRVLALALSSAALAACSSPGHHSEPTRTTAAAPSCTNAATIDIACADGQVVKYVKGSCTEPQHFEQIFCAASSDIPPFAQGSFAPPSEGGGPIGGPDGDGITRPEGVAPRPRPGMPPGAVGLPILPPREGRPACLRLAGEAALNAAYIRTEGAADCSVEDVTPVESQKTYSITVSCEGVEHGYRVRTKATKDGAGCKVVGKPSYFRPSSPMAR